MQALLMIKDLWKLVVRDEKQPTDKDDLVK